MKYLFRLLVSLLSLTIALGVCAQALYGDFERGPFESGGEQIWVARKA